MRALILLTLISVNIKSFSQEVKEFPKIALTNHVTFMDSSFNNPLAGCAFLVDYNNTTYAVTCKHALWVAKSDKMKGIHFENSLLEWKMQVKNDSLDYIITGKLLNEDRNEPIGEQNVFSDYLIFTIKENHSSVKPLKIRKSAPKEHEILYSIGWSFNDKEGPQRIYKYKFHKMLNTKILMESIGGYPGAGISGSALVDKNGELVGIISDYAQDPETGKWYLSPCNNEYLLKILNN